LERRVTATRCERAHLITAESAFSSINARLTSVLDEFSRFREENLRADRWLPSSLAGDFSSYLKDGADKLKSWIRSPPVESEAAKALADLAGWFMQFVVEQTETLRSIADGDSPDSVFYRVIEVSDCVKTAADPRSCLRLLAEADEAVPAIPPDQSDEADEDVPSTVPQVPQPTQIGSLAPEIISALEQRKWQTVIDICRIGRTTAPDEEVRRLNEIADFALALDSISRPESADSLVTAARLLGTVGQPVHRSYPPISS
jgi:hypothetical protein